MSFVLLLIEIYSKVSAFAPTRLQPGSNPHTPHRSVEQLRFSNWLGFRKLSCRIKRLLTFSHYPTTDISLKMGFHEATNMIRFFRRHTQLSPKELRQVCRQNDD
ncbi:helix-turn-helix domain-containing protein [Endozoicomonas acroporae]|uniref:helix-turn-helix domain-containing protein n=1 Tax=Endozoicomonas acroporae TaxID=1701104 RepID=UPI000C76D07C